MKKILLAIVTTLIFAVNVKAQKHGPWDIYIGPRIGVIMNDFTDVEGSMETGMLLGVNAEVFFSNTISLNMGFNYTHQGGNNVKKGDTGIYDYDLDYINTEFALRYYPVDRFCVFAGVNLGRVVKSRIDGKEGRYGLKDYMHKGSVAFPVGLAANFKNCELGVSYSYQINKIARGSFADYLGDARNKSLVASFVYRFQIF